MASEIKPILDENTGVMRTTVENELAGRWINLADTRLGAMALYASDDFFADKARMLNPAPAVFIPGKYDNHGKWMDGWESRRKRVAGHDHCIVRLGLPGIIKGFDIDTSHFTGNFPPAASVDACLSKGDPTKATKWIEILPAVSLSGNSHHVHGIDNDKAWSHVRLNIFPDGGVARFRVYGQVARDWSKLDRKKPVDLAAVVNGARLVGCSDQHYGSPLNILYPGIAANMGEGWETHRRREPGNEWAIFALGHRGRVGRVEVDTTHFKGNYPDRCSLQAALVTGGTDQSIVTQSMFWATLLPEQKLQMDRPHAFEKQIVDLGPVSHVRFNSIPDGGVNRLRLFGRVS